MVDYSKWKNIEISDDEDETHPNIDTPSLFRWRHQARVERMEERKKQVEDFEKRKTENEKKMKETKAKLEQAEKLQPADVDALKQALKHLEVECQKIKKDEEEINKKEKLTPWNVDTISKPGFEKTIINKKAARPKNENLTDEELEARMKKFIKQNEKLLKHFGMLQKYDDSKAYLTSNPQLVCEDTANYLVIWCIELEMEDKSNLMEHVAHQTMIMQYILELAKQLDTDPRACLSAFFAKIQLADVEYKKIFDDELSAFKERVRKRAAEKLEKALKDAEEEEKRSRLGPGGLDPVEVFESLPDELKKCFESQDIQLLQDTITKMNEKDAKYHMKRCIDSGLWVPDASKKDEAAGDAKAEETRASTSS